MVKCNFIIFICTYQKKAVPLHAESSKGDWFMKDNEPLYFLSFCVEAYKMRHHLTGAETMKLFDETGATQYIIDGYDMLHTQGERWIVEDIEEYLQQHS